MALGPGSVGDDVVSLQLTLVGAGLLAGEPTATFDEATRRAVVEVQRRAGLAQTGVVDERTWSALLDMLPAEPTQVVTTPRPPNLIEGEQQDITGTVPRSALLMAGLMAGGLYWFMHRRKKVGGVKVSGDEDFGDDDDEFEDDEEEEEEDEPSPRRHKRVRLSDATTDSLIDEPAAIAARGRAGDCKKAAMLLAGRRMLAKNERERTHFNKVARRVVDDCRGAENELEEAVEEIQARQADIAEELGVDLPGPSKKLYEQGFRKSKRTMLRKTKTEHGDARAKGRGRAGRPGASAVRVRKADGSSHRLRKEKAKTKRGYTWRRENE